MNEGRRPTHRHRARRLTRRSARARAAPRKRRRIAVRAAVLGARAQSSCPPIGAAAPRGSSARRRTLGAASLSPRRAVARVSSDRYALDRRGTSALVCRVSAACFLTRAACPCRRRSARATGAADSPIAAISSPSASRRAADERVARSPVRLRDAHGAPSGRLSPPCIARARIIRISTRTTY